MGIRDDGYVSVANLDAIPDSGVLQVEVDDRYIVLAKVDGQVYCLDDVCTHDGGPLGEGHLEDYCLVCPRHGAKFDVRDGAAVTMPATEPTTNYPVKVESDQVFVKF